MKSLLPRDKRITVALAISLALHLAVLFTRFSTPEAGLPNAKDRASSRLDVTLARPADIAKAAPAPQPMPTPPPKSAPKPPVVRMKREPATVSVPAKTWTATEKTEMNQFLNELGAQPKPRSGSELAQSALATARSMTSAEEREAAQQNASQTVGAKVEPFSLELYLDALFRKMNRSAAMLRNEHGANGLQVATVQIVLNSDGSVKSFRALQAADQQAEIAYIKAVVEQAAPFPAFPPDIRRARDSFSIQICILPNRFAEDGGPMFSRMSKGQSCREPS
jgi:outer membrane biosynthesis protein TonB